MPASSEAAARFHAQIHLDVHGLGEGLDHLARPEAAQPRLTTLDQRGQGSEELEIALEGRLNTRPQDLDGDLARRRQLEGLALFPDIAERFGPGQRQMHLSDRGGGDRLIVEVAEQRLDRPAELALDDRPRFLGREGRQLVLQL